MKCRTLKGWMRSFVVLVGCRTLLGAATAGALPAGPVQPVFDPMMFGAKGDGTTNDRVALQRAIDACKGSGGSVYLHDGRFLSGQLTLGSDMTLFIAPSATLVGLQSTDDGDYSVQSARTENHMNQTCQKRLIWGEGLKNVSITGGGVIDGRGDFPAWRNGKEKVVERLRPSILELSQCEKVEVSHLTLRRSAMWTQVYLECTGVIVRDLQVDTENIPGTRDGLDICDCHDVLIERCAIKAQDDGICFKSGNAVGCQDIVVRDCVVDKLGNGAGNGVKFGTASFGALRNVLCERIVVSNTRNSAFTWESVDGATIDHVELRDCRAVRTGQVISVILGERHGVVGQISNLVFRNIHAEAGLQPIACLLSGAPGHLIRNVQFVGLELHLPGGVPQTPGAPAEYRGEYPEGTHFGPLPGYAFYVRHADGVSFQDCQLTTEAPDARSWLATDDATNVTVSNVTDRGTLRR